MRKTSQAALLVLLEQGLLSKADMETKVCPVLLELTEPSSDDDYKIEAVAVRKSYFEMGKIPLMLLKNGNFTSRILVKAAIIVALWSNMVVY